MTGTLGGALEARGIDASGGKLTSESEGDVEVENGVLVIKRIRIHYKLAGCPEDKREAAERAHSAHPVRCPVHQTISHCVPMTTTLEYV